MHLTYLIRSRVWVVPVALAILGFCLTIFVCLSGTSQEPFGFDELYGSWIERAAPGPGNRLSTVNTHRDYTQNEVPSGRADHDVPRLSWWRYGPWAARRSGRMAQG